MAVAVDPSEAEVEAGTLRALDAGDAAAAATAVIQGYGPRISGYLTRLLESETDASDAFSLWAEQIWRGIPGFERRSRVKTWAFKAAWSAAMRVRDEAWRRLHQRLETGVASRLAATVRTQTAVRLESQAAHLAELRAELSQADQTLLVLRLDQQMSWDEAAEVLSAAGGPVDAVALRKRYERIKRRLAELLRRQARPGPRAGAKKRPS